MTTSPVLNALYRHQDGEAEAAAASAPALDVFELSALGRPRELEQLLDTDPSLANAIAVDGFTPLQLAAYFSREPAVTVLLDHGAEANSHASNQQMVTALHAAASGGSKPIVRALLAAALIPTQDRRTITPPFTRPQIVVTPRWSRTWWRPARRPNKRTATGCGRLITREKRASKSWRTDWSA
jgi:ankyrin repeat protein